MYSFPDLEPVCCYKSSSNCCFLACIQISQEAGQVVWYFHLLKNFPVSCDPHNQGFGVVNKAEIDVFLELSCFFHDPADVGNLISGSSAFATSSLYLWKIMVHVGETVETVSEFILGGSTITADGDCTHEIKRSLLLGRKAMTNLDSILKSRDVTLPTKVHPVVMYGYESWTVKKAEH